MTSDRERLRDLEGLSLKERRLRGELLALHSSLNGRAELAEVGLFSQVSRDRTRGNGLKLCQVGFRLDIGEEVGQALEQAAQEMVECP